MTGRPILICGAGGQIGQTLAQRLRQTGRDVVAFDRRTLDITDTARVQSDAGDIPAPRGCECGGVHSGGSGRERTRYCARRQCRKRPASWP